MGGGGEPNYEEERRTETLPRHCDYSRVKGRQCQFGGEINMGARPRSLRLSSLEVQPCLTGLLRLSVRLPRLQGTGERKSPPQHQKLQRHTLCDLLFRRRSYRLNGTNRTPQRKMYRCGPPAYSTLGELQMFLYFFESS